MIRELGDCCTGKLADGVFFEQKTTGLIADIKTAIRLLNGHIRSLGNKEKVKTTFNDKSNP